MSTTSSVPNGSATSSRQGSLLLGTSTTETSATSCPPISPDTAKSTSSPESDSGRWLSGWLAGATLAPFGQCRVRANLSARQAVAAGYLTIAISGQPPSGSSPSTRLARSLGSKLRARTVSLGSTLYRLTWSHWATPSGRWISRQRASVLRTSDNDCSGWPTPDAHPDAPNTSTNRGSKWGGERPRVGPSGLGPAALLAGWPSPTATDAVKGGVITPRPGMICLVAAAQMAGWQTPAATDGERSGTMTAGMTGQSLTQQSRLAGWATLQACDSRGSAGKKPHTELTWQTANLLVGWAAPKESDHRPGHASRMLDTSRINLNDQAMMAGWATPATRDYRTPNHSTYSDRGGGPKGEQLNNQVAHLIPGASLNGSSAQTSGGGLLNPEHSRWLQGIPREWPDFAPSPSRRGSQETSPSCERTATRSIRGSRPK